MGQATSGQVHGNILCVDWNDNTILTCEAGSYVSIRFAGSYLGNAIALPYASPHVSPDSQGSQDRFAFTAKTVNRKPLSKRPGPGPGRPRVRKGCSTCKIRKIKCDEKKPACEKCTSTGRKCDGYEELGARLLPSPGQPPFSEKTIATTANDSSNGIESKAMSSISLQCRFSNNEDECRIFDFFRSATGPNLTGNFDSNFWDKFVLSVAHFEPAVKHALIALGSLHESYHRNYNQHCHISYYSEPNVDSLQHYNKAIATINRDINTYGSKRNHVVLCTCALFLVFEVLRGNDLAALIHLRSGLRILQQSDSEASETSSDITAGDGSDQALRQLFLRFSIQASSYARLRLPNPKVNLHPCSTLGTVSEARRSLDEILCVMYHMIRNTARKYCYRPPKEIPSSITVQKQSLLFHLTDWASKLDLFLRNNRTKLSLKDLCGTMVLKMDQLIANIMLSTCLLPEEGHTYDVFTNEFEQIVSLAESLSTVNRTDRVFFTMEMGVVQPLYVTVLKCREYTIRHRAIALLKKTGREGIWNGPLAALVAEKAVAFEEAERIDGKIPELARIHTALAEMYPHEREIVVKCTRARNPEWTEWEELLDFIAW